jgi:hypothetical protein
VEEFVAECIPGLRDAEVVDVAAASGVDTCWYDLGTVYDIGRFAPARFAAEEVAS